MTVASRSDVLGESGRLCLLVVVLLEWRAGEEARCLWCWLVVLIGRSRDQRAVAPAQAGLVGCFMAAGCRGLLAATATAVRSKPPRGWLLVIDDVGGPDEVRGLVEELPHGEIVMTSRQGGGWQGLARVVRVGELSLEDSGRLLERVVRDGWVGEADLTGASELCERLGRLPVAIDQAGGVYCAERG